MYWSNAYFCYSSKQNGSIDFLKHGEDILWLSTIHCERFLPVNLIIIFSFFLKEFYMLLSSVIFTINTIIQLWQNTKKCMKKCNECCLRMHLSIGNSVYSIFKRWPIRPYGLMVKTVDQCLKVRGWVIKGWTGVHSLNPVRWNRIPNLGALFLTVWPPGLNGQKLWIWVLKLCA